MSKQRLIDTRFWDDSYVLTLDPSEKLLFLYLLTNPLTAICGVYEVALRRIAFDTGFDADTVTRILGRLERDGRCVYRDGWIALHNWLKYQTASPRVRQGIEAQLKGVPSELAGYVRGESLPEPELTVSEGIPTVSHLNLNLNPNPNPNPNYKTSTSPAPESPLGAEAKQCLDYYFDKHRKPPPEGRGFEPIIAGGRDMQLFKAMLKKYDVAAIKEVIDAFFAWPTRSNFSTRALYNKFDTLYGVLKDKVEGRR